MGACEGFAWKALEVKFNHFHNLVATRHRHGHAPDWSVDPFHNFIYQNHMGKWLRKNGRELEEHARCLVSGIALECEVFPSDSIVAGKAVRAKKSSQTKTTSVAGGQSTSVSCGQYSTMATPVWLTLYVLAPNCMCNPKSRIKKHIAEKYFSILSILVLLAYQGHTASSDSGCVQDALTLQIDQGSAKVQADGSLNMDMAWSA